MFKEVQAFGKTHEIAVVDITGTVSCHQCSLYRDSKCHIDDLHNTDCFKRPPHGFNYSYAYKEKFECLPL